MSVHAGPLAAAIRGIERHGRLVTVTTPPPEGAGSGFDPVEPIVVREKALQTKASISEVDGNLIAVTDREYIFAGDVAIGTNSHITDGISRQVKAVMREQPGETILLTYAWTKQ